MNIAKIYLQQIYKLEQEINVKSRSITEINSKLQKCTSVLTDIKNEPRVYKDQIERLIDRKTSLQEYISDKVCEMLDKRLEIVKMINSLEKSEHRILLELRYLQFKKWSYIAEYMCYSKQHIYLMHGKALKEVELVLTKDKSK